MEIQKIKNMKVGNMRTKLEKKPVSNHTIKSNLI